MRQTTAGLAHKGHTALRQVSGTSDTEASLLSEVTQKRKMHSRNCWFPEFCKSQHYCISLHSSSSSEPRHPSLKVLNRLKTTSLDSNLNRNRRQQSRSKAGLLSYPLPLELAQGQLPVHVQALTLHFHTVFISLCE